MEKERKGRVVWYGKEDERGGWSERVGEESSKRMEETERFFEEWKRREGQGGMGGMVRASEGVEKDS
jgi:hypothetical protein